MDRARVIERHGFAVSQACVAKTIEIKTRRARRKKYSKIEHLARFRIELGMRGEWAGIIQASPKCELPTGLQGIGIKLPRQPLFSKSQQTLTKGIHAYIDRRFQA